MNHIQSPTHFPRQVGEIVLEFDDWANKVRQQMMTCLKKDVQDKISYSTKKNGQETLKPHHN